MLWKILEVEMNKKNDQCVRSTFSKGMNCMSSCKADERLGQSGTY